MAAPGDLGAQPRQADHPEAAAAGRLGARLQLRDQLPAGLRGSATAQAGAGAVASAVPGHRARHGIPLHDLTLGRARRLLTWCAVVWAGYVSVVKQIGGQRARRAASALLRAARPVTVAERIERAPILDRPVSAMADVVVHALPPGRGADALHGVPFGQPAHPALVQATVGCWTSSVLLDLLGGPGTERAAATLAAAGVAA